MKRIKSFVVLFMLLMLSTVMFACTGGGNNGSGGANVKVETIRLFDETGREVANTDAVQIPTIDFYEGETKTFTFQIEPSNATVKTVELSSSDNRVVQTSLQNGVVVITAGRDVFTDNTSTYFSVKTKDGSNIEAIVSLRVNKVSAPLSVVENIRVEYVEAADAYYLNWDSVNQTGLRGYVVSLNGEDMEATPNTSMKITRLGEELTAKVRAVGVVEELNLKDNGGDYIYSEPYTFKVLNAPQNAEQEDGNIMWTAVEGVQAGYDVHIKNNSIDNVEHVGNAYTAYTSEFSTVGKYEVKIKALGDRSKNIFDSPFSSLVNFTRLATPTLTFNSSIARWSSVEFASNYNLVVTGPTLDEPLSLSLLSNSYYPDYAQYQPGVYTYKVMAVGDGVNSLSSEFSSEYQMTKLDKVTGLTVSNGNKLVWDSYPEAHGYFLVMNGKASWVEAQVTQFSFPENKAAGTDVVSIYANGDGRTTFQSNESDKIYVTKLDKPVITGIVDGVLKWNPVTNAEYYNVWLDDVDQGDNFTAASGYRFDDEISAGTHRVAIKALAGGGYDEVNSVYRYMLYSQYSATYSATKLSAPKNIKVENGQLVWDKVANATGYTLTINEQVYEGDGEGEQEEIKLAGSKYKYEFTNEEAGSYYVTLSTYADNSSYITSAVSEPLTVIKLRPATIGFENGELTVRSNQQNAYQGQEAPEVRREYYVTDVETGSIRKEDDITKIKLSIADNQKITVNAIDFADGYIPSKVSNTITCTKLGKVTDLVIQNGVLSWQATGNVSSYNIELIGADSTNTVNNGAVTSFNIATATDAGIMADGTWQVKVAAVGNTLIGGEEQPLFMSGDYTLYVNNNNSYINILSLVSGANFGVTDYVNYIYSPKFDNVGGKLFWKEVNYADGYKLRVSGISEDEGAFVTDYDMGKNTSTLLEFLDAGTYTVSVYAYGDNVTNIMQRTLNGGLNSYKTSVERTVCKLKEVKDVTVKDGKLSWTNGSLDYNNGASTNVYCAYLALINDNYYSLNNFDKCLAGPEAFNENIFNSVAITEYGFEAYFIEGNYDVQIYTVPLNYKNVSNDISYILSKPSAEKTFYKREAPSNIKIEGGVVSWAVQSVSGHTLDYDYQFANGQKFLAGTPADFYELTIMHGDTSIKRRFQQTEFTSGQIPHFDFYDYYTTQDPTFNFETGSYSFVVKMLSIGTGDDYFLNSNVSDVVSTEILNSEGILKVEYGQLCWESVPGAEGYQLQINNLVMPVITANTFNFSSDFDASEYSIKIKVLGNMTSTLSSVYSSSFVAKKLPVPEDLRLDRGLILYNSVEHVNYYSIVVNDDYREDAGTATSFELPNTYGRGEYTIKIQAMGNTTAESGNAFLNSDVSGYLTTTNGKTVLQKFGKVENIFVRNGVLNWSSVSEGLSVATTYILNVNGIEISVEGTFIHLQETVVDIHGNTYSLGGGTSYTVQVKARGTSVSYLNGDYNDTPKQVVKLPKVENLCVNNGVISWSDETTVFYIGNQLRVNVTNIDNLTTYDYITNLDTNNEYFYSLPTFVENDDGSYVGYPKGVYEVSFVNMGDDTIYLNSDLSRTVDVQKLDTPTNLSTKELLIEHFDGDISNEVSLVFNNYDRDANHYKLSIQDNDTGIISTKIIENSSDRAYYITIAEKHLENNNIELPVVHDYTYSFYYLYNGEWRPTTASLVYTDSRQSRIKELCFKFDSCEISANGYKVDIINENSILQGSVFIPMEEIYRNYIAHFVTISDLSGMDLENLDSYNFVIEAYNAQGAKLNTEVGTIVNVLENEISIGFNYLTNNVSYITLTVDDSASYSAQTRFEVADILTYFSLMSVEMNVEAGDYIFKLQAVGESQPVGFNYSLVNSDFSEGKQIKKPEKPVLVVVQEVGEISGVQEYTGEVIWQSIENVSGYFVEYKYLSTSEMNSKTQLGGNPDWTNEDLYWNDIDWIRVDVGTETSYFVGNSGYYILRATSYLTDYGLTSANSDTVALYYSIFYDSNDADEGGNGTANNPYKIDSVSKFMRIAYNLDAHYKLTKDINFLDVEYMPIGNNAERFNGVLDGDKYSLQNLSISTYTDAFGLFSYIGTNGVVKNLNIDNISITNGKYIGTIATYNYGTIENCVVSGTITTSIATEIVVGGFVAENYGTVTKCINYANIQPNNPFVSIAAGGIAGHNNNNAVIIFCGNEGEISAHIAGGIAGSNYSGAITACYNKGDVTATSVNAADGIINAFAGGIVGYNESNESSFTTISLSINYGKVHAVSSATTIYAYAGGITAQTVSGKIVKCLSIGEFSVECQAGSSANLKTGSLVGDLGTWESGTSITESYYFIPASNDSNNYYGSGDSRLISAEAYNSTKVNIICNNWKVNSQPICEVDGNYPRFIWVASVQNYFFGS